MGTIKYWDNEGLEFTRDWGWGAGGSAWGGVL